MNRSSQCVSEPVEFGEFGYDCSWGWAFFLTKAIGIFILARFVLPLTNPSCAVFVFVTFGGETFRQGGPFNSSGSRRMELEVYWLGGVSYGFGRGHDGGWIFS